MNARHVNFAVLERRKGDAAAHQTRHQVLLVVFSHMLAGQKHRRVATADKIFRRTVSRSLSNLTLTRLFVETGLDDQAIGVSAQAT